MKWYNDITKLFMSRGYLDKNQTIEDKISIISKHSSNILGKGKDFENKLKEYIKKGWYIIPTPVWKNFHPNTLETPISCVVGDTWINTSTGGKMAKDIQVGDLVLTHKNRFKKVTNVIPSVPFVALETIFVPAGIYSIDKGKSWANSIVLAL